MRELSRGGAGMGVEMSALFDGDLNPVAPKAQRKVHTQHRLHICWLPVLEEEQGKYNTVHVTIRYR